MAFELTLLETRILGCLLEKERLTPENYPLSLNAVVAACNQSTNREPVSSYDEKTVEGGLGILREKKLASVIFGAGSRVQKYRHRLPEHFTLDPRETALLCVLLLRGPQTPGELRSRSERMFHFPSLEAVQASLDALSGDSASLVRMLDARPGQKERRYLQLLSAPVAETDGGAEAVFVSAAPINPIPDRLATLEREVVELRGELAALREEMTAFRQQFE